MLGNQPLTRESLLENLELPENADLKKRVTNDPVYTETILKLVLKIDEAFNSYDEFKSSMEAYENKNRLRDTLAGSEAIV